jgi:hypothetical protein
MHALLVTLLRGHEVDHVNGIRWSGKRDVPLLIDAGRRGYRVFVTNNLGQFLDPAECDAIKRSRMHHVTCDLDDGLDGLGRACGALAAAMRGLVEELDKIPAQRIARVIGLAKRTRYEITDPGVDPPSAYWP